MTQPTCSLTCKHCLVHGQKGCFVCLTAVWMRPAGWKSALFMWIIVELSWIVNFHYLSTWFLCGTAQSSILGATSVRKCFWVSPLIELLDVCHPSPLCSPIACAYYVNKPYTNRILYDSCPIFLHVTCVLTTNKLITVQYISLSIITTYHLVILFLSATYKCSNWSFKSTATMLWL
jgi:hypothetical protein